MSFLNRVNQVQKMIQTLLEEEVQDKEATLQAQLAFTPKTDLSLVKGLSEGLPDSHFERMVVLFSRLSMFFEGGILLENKDTQWLPQAAFYRGHMELLAEKHRVVFKMGSSEILKIERAEALPILEKVKLDHWDQADKMSCLKIKVSPDFCFLLFSLSADHWLKPLAEKIQTSLADGISL